MTVQNPSALIEVAIDKIKLADYPDAERENCYGYLKAMRDLGHITDARWLALETQAYLACKERRAELRNARNQELMRNTA